MEEKEKLECRIQELERRLHRMVEGSRGEMTYSVIYEKIEKADQEKQKMRDSILWGYGSLGEEVVDL